MHHRQPLRATVKLNGTFILIFTSLQHPNTDAQGHARLLRHGVQFNGLQRSNFTAAGELE